MINVSNAFKEELNNDNRNYICKVDVTLKGEESVSFSLENKNLWSDSLSIEESVSNSDSFDIGSTIINSATIVINNIYDNYTSYDFSEAKVVITIGLKLSDGTTETINKGIFYVDNAKYNGALITLECLDAMSKFDKDYSESTLEYPATIRQIVQDACSKCDVLYSAAAFDNDDYIVENRPADESLTFRQMLNYVGQISCQQFSIDHSGRLIARWYDRDTMNKLYESPDTVDDSDYHHISAINSQNIDMDDVVITGVKVVEFSEDSENPGETYLSGGEGYVIEIKDNKLIPVGKGNEVSTYLGNKLVGMRFRPMELTFQNDPTIEPTDITEVIDNKGNHYYTFITSTKFTVGNSQTLSCSAKSALRNSASRYSQYTQAYTDSKNLVSKERTEREKAIEALQETLANSSGMYITEEKQPDGSVITYLHDKPTLEESQNIIKITAEAIGISNDGGDTYPYGLFLTGDLIARLLYVVGINADYINSGAITISDNDGEITFYADTVTGRVEIRAETLTITGKTVQEIATEQSDSAINDFVDAVYNPGIENLQAQIDGQIETWFYSYVPTTNNYPASEWTTDAEKDKHLGDLFYIVDNAEYGGQAYRWAKINNVYQWDYVEDTAVTKALADAAQAQDTADQKRRVFISTPTPPYDVGDLWAQGNNGDIMRCRIARKSGSYNANDWVKASKYTDDSALEEFISGDFQDSIDDLKAQADQKSETWYQSTDPSTAWTTTTAKNEHIGDIWYNTSSSVQKSYRWNGTAWQEMKSTPPDAVFDEIDGKAQIFISTPTVPYYVGDLWFNSESSDIMTCIRDRTSGSYAQSDWQKRNKYTDDSAVEDLDVSLDQEEVFNRLTNNGAMNGLYMSSNQLYVNASYIRSGTLVLGGSNNSNGTLSVRNASNTEIGRWDRNGIYINGGSIYNTTSSTGVSIQGGRMFLSYGDDEVGFVGTNYLASDTSQRGVVFDLQYPDGDYMSWASQQSSGGNYMIKMIYTRNSTSTYDANTMHFGCDVNMRNYQLKNVSWPNGGVTLTLNYVQVLKMNSDGTVARWGPNGQMTFTNGILTDINYYT